MGYELHITRRESWHDPDGPEIVATEWLELVDGDPELRLDPRNGPHFATCRRAAEPEEQWLDWSDGNLHTKNPDRWFVCKMIEVASRLEARVVGDEGEEYTAETIDRLLGEADAEVPADPLAWLRPVRRWIRGRLRRRAPIAEAPPFKKGDRVRDLVIGEGTVVHLDRKAELGAGRVRVRFDNGHEVTYLLIAHGLRPVSE